MNLEGRNMTKLCPDGEAKIPKCDRLIILNEECLARRRTRGHQVFRCENMGIGNVTHVGDIPQVESIPDYEGSFVFGNACVDGWNELVVSRSKEYRGSKGACHHLTAGCLQD
jgi:hypothetical protein